VLKKQMTINPALEHSKHAELGKQLATEILKKLLHYIKD